jgi:hypothetical protein
MNRDGSQVKACIITGTKRIIHDQRDSGSSNEKE